MYSMFCNITKFAELKIIMCKNVSMNNNNKHQEVFKEEEEKHVLYAMKKNMPPLR